MSDNSRRILCEDLFKIIYEADRVLKKNKIQLNLDEANQVIRLLELIENHDDVQKVHTNFQIK